MGIAQKMAFCHTQQGHIGIVKAGICSDILTHILELYLPILKTIESSRKIIWILNKEMKVKK
jgi:hypothetical protein